jgi:hypothetical protein
VRHRGEQRSAEQRRSKCRDYRKSSSSGAVARASNARNKRKLFWCASWWGSTSAKGRAHQALEASLARPACRRASLLGVRADRPLHHTGCGTHAFSSAFTLVPSLSVPNIRLPSPCTSTPHRTRSQHPLATFAPRATRRPIQPAHQYAAQPPVQRRSRIQIARSTAITHTLTHTSRPRRPTRRPRLHAQLLFFSAVAAALAPANSLLHVAVWATTQKGR